MQNFKSSTATVIELRFFMKKKKEMKMKMKNLRKSYLPVFHTSCDIFIQFFCMQLLLYMFSTLMSLEDRSRLKLKVKTNMYGYNAGPPMAILSIHIMLAHQGYFYIHSTTILCGN